MEAGRCAICGGDAAALHHVVAKCHSRKAVIGACGEHHQDLDALLWYAGVHRRDRSTSGAADRDYALVRGMSDVHSAMWRAAGSDPRLIELIGRAQYALGRVVAAQVSPAQRIGPRPPTSGAFQIKVERVTPRKSRSPRGLATAPDGLDRLRVACSLWAGLIEDYSDDRRLQQSFGEIAEGIGNDRLRDWVGSYRTAELDGQAEVFLRDVGPYVDALLASTSCASVSPEAITSVTDSIQVLAAHLRSSLMLLVDLSRCRSQSHARRAVDAFIARQNA